LRTNESSVTRFPCSRACIRTGLDAALGLFVVVLLLGGAGWLKAVEAPAATPPAAPAAAATTNELTLKTFLQLVLQRNESLHARVLEFEISHKRLKAEQGAFEPEFVLGYDRVENERENTAEQRRSSGVLVFKEKNNIYNAGLEALVPSGARVRLGYSLRDLNNNLQDPVFGSIVTNVTKGEFASFAGVSLTQPLLKNAWLNANLANIRLAALASDVAFQEYRRQMMLIISTAEASYWNLYMMQEQVRFFEDSVRLAGTLVADNKTRLEAGKAAELEVLESEAGLALRQTKLAEAQQKYYETAAQLLTLVSLSSPTGAPRLVRALDRPGITVQVPQFVESGQVALELNPDYLSQYKKAKQEDIRVAYAKNQRLPQLDLKASYGLNGLGGDPGESWDDIEHTRFPSFTAGVELRIPLAGGQKVKRELDAARLRKEQALVTLKETETQVLNAIETSLRKVTSAVESARNYENVVAFNQSLLTTELARLDAGKVTSRRVLEVEASLFEARNSVIEAKVLYERAHLELELVQGTLLRSRNVDLPQKELETRTTTLLRGLGLNSQHLDQFSQELRQSYQTSHSPNTTANPDEYDRALQRLRESLKNSPTPP
jgi:outer membrane protein TolC